jgi:hypothetical protein
MIWNLADLNWVLKELRIYADFETVEKNVKFANKKVTGQKVA